MERGSHWFFCFSFVFQFEVLFGSSLYILISLLKLSISLLWLLSCFKHIHDFSWKDCCYDCFKNLCQAVLAQASCWHCCLSLSELVETRLALVLSLRVHPPCLWRQGLLLAWGWVIKPGWLAESPRPCWVYQFNGAVLTWWPSVPPRFRLLQGKPNTLVPWTVQRSSIRSLGSVASTKGLCSLSCEVNWSTAL